MTKSAYSHLLPAVRELADQPDEIASGASEPPAGSAMRGRAQHLPNSETC